MSITCSRVGFKGFVARQTLTGFVISVHEHVPRAGGVGEVIAVIVSEASVLEGHHLPDGVIAPLGLWYPHVTLLVPRRIRRREKLALAQN
mgnify:CR=1 FL=1